MKTKVNAAKTVKVISKITEGVFASAVDASLWFVAYFASMSSPQSSVGQLWRAERSADEFLEKVNYETIKQGIKAARLQGLLKPGARGRRAWPEITAAGKKRLRLVLPQYNEQRVWDGRMYLVTYDIPEKLHQQRDLLREFLERLGCAKLQESVYLTPYDPRDILRGFIKEREISGTIIVSDIGRDGSIGDSDLATMLERVYKLEGINQRYMNWLEKSGEREIDRGLIISYYAILKVDPQLPFALLPKWWRGDEAYKKVKPFLK